MKPSEIQSILSEHDNLWELQREEQERLRDIYETRFYAQRETPEGQLQVQTADAYATIEGYIGQLYTKNPACRVKEGMRGLGNPEVAEAVANGFLLSKGRVPIEHASRLGLIHPCAFLKLVPRESDDVYEKMLPVGVPPWEVIVDLDAPCWEESRFVGHVYWMPKDAARKRWKNRKWSAVRRKPYFQHEEPVSPSEAQVAPETKFDAYVRIVEFYDFTTGKLDFWSPHAEGDTLLSAVDIPFKGWDGRRLSTLVPFFFSSMPDRPMKGYSMLRRVYDQLYEKNIVRSFQANAVRKVARQFVTRKGTLDEENQGQMRSGVDGLVMEVELDPGVSLADAIMPVPHTPMPAETDRYIQQVMDDQHTSMNQDPFARGQGLGGRASAAEVAALVSYSSSDLGHMARMRDAAIEELVRVYLAGLAVFVDEKTAPILVDGASVVPTATDLLGDFRVFAEDEGQTPVSEAMRQQQFFVNVPTLQALGADPGWLLKQAAQMLGFDDIPKAPPPPAAPAAGPLSGAPGALSPGEAIANPSPENVSGMLNQ